MKYTSATMAALLAVSTLGACAASPGPTADSPTPTTVVGPTTTEVTLTASQRNAQRSAKNYINIGAFSRPGLIRQLEFEKYSTADAEIAIDSLAIDWTQQAAKSAARYLSMSAFSHEGLVSQLVNGEGFDPEVAEAAVVSVGL